MRSRKARQSDKTALPYGFIIYRQRRMVAETLVLVNARRVRGVCDAGRGDLIVDAPTNVFSPSLAAVRPPGVRFQFWMQLAEHIDQTGLVEHLR